MTMMQVQSILHYASSLPEDVAVNTFYLDVQPGSDPFEETLADIAVTAAVQFWNDTLSTGRQLSNWLSPYVRRGQGLTVKVYDPAAPPPRAPLTTQTFDLVGSSSGSSLPLECAVVTSFQGARVSGVSQARRRGRLYLGPLKTTVVDGGSTSQPPTVTASVLADIVAATKALANGSSGTGTATWRLYVRSRVTNSYTAVTNGWVDNEMDTQRRRQKRPTARTTWTEPPPV